MSKSSSAAHALAYRPAVICLTMPRSSRLLSASRTASAEPPIEACAVATLTIGWLGSSSISLDPAEPFLGEPARPRHSSMRPAILAASAPDSSAAERHAYENDEHHAAISPSR